MTLVNAFKAVFDVEYAADWGKFPRLVPDVDDMLITDPPIFEALINLQTVFATNQDPVKLVAKTLPHSLSEISRGEFRPPVQKSMKSLRHRNQILDRSKNLATK